MNLIKLTLTSFLMTSLIACGGGSPDKDTDTPNLGTGNESTGGEGNTTTEDGTTTSTNTNIGTPGIGNGTGSSYIANTIAVANAGLVDGKLSAGGQVNISVDIVDLDNESARVSGTTYGVVFSSPCSDINPPQAGFDNPELIVSQGKAETTYRAQGCSGDDLVTARLYSAPGGEIDKTSVIATAQATINVVPPVVNDISYVGADNKILGISKVGNPALPQVAKLTFKVTDINGDPIANQKVDFAFASGVTTASLATTSQITNPAGEVTAIVNAAQNRTSVQVIASTAFTNSDGDSDTTFVSSESIAVNTGFPVQKKMTLALSTFNPFGIEEVGATVDATVYLADEYGNPPPEGTVVNFTTEGGSIGANCETDAAGTCSVQWLAQNNVPGLGTHSGNEVNEKIGFSTIMAYTQGDSDYTDLNNNGVFDIGEPYSVYAEPFRDDNFNSTRQPEEPAPIDVDNNGNHTPVSGVSKYQGTLCSQAARDDNHCTTNMSIWKQQRLVMSGLVARNSGVQFYNTSGAQVFQLNAGNSYYLVLQDSYGNIPASGTSVTYSAEGFETDGEDGPVENTIGAINIAGLPAYGDAFIFSVKDEDPADNPASPEFEVVVSQADGSTLKVSIPII